MRYLFEGVLIDMVKNQKEIKIGKILDYWQSRVDSTGWVVGSLDGHSLICEQDIREIKGYVESIKKLRKEIETLQLVGWQSNPSDERGAGYKLGSLNICDIVLKLLEAKE